MAVTKDNLAHSYSSLKMFEQCPKRFYHQRITKEVKDRVDETAEARAYGDAVHSHLDAYFNSGLELPEALNFVRDMCLKLKLVHVNSEPPTLGMSEQKWALSKELEPVGFFDKKAWLRSIIDLAIIAPDGEAFVIDWKTGKRRPDFNQLEMFALQTWRHYPKIKTVTSAFVWLKDQKIEADYKTYHVHEEPDISRKLYARTMEIEKALDEGAWPAKPSGLCPWCPLFEVCEERQKR